MDFKKKSTKKKIIYKTIMLKPRYQEMEYRK
jgi:hypothetical protein